MDPTESVNRVRTTPSAPRSSPTDPPVQVFAEKILEYRLEADCLSASSSSPPLGLSSAQPHASSYGGGLIPDIVLSIDSLWHDPIIPSVLDRSSEFYLMDSAA